jgi:RNA polymerase sigma factor (sigma-70 family)
MANISDEKKEFDHLNEQKSDEELILVALKNPNAFSEIVTRYEDAFLRKAKRIFGSNIEAEYAVQDAFVKIYVNLGKFRVVEGARFSSWAYKILLNTCFEYYRKAKREQEFVSYLDNDELSFFSDEAEPLDREGARNKVLFLIAKLPDIFRPTAKLHYIEYKSQKEISSLLGISNEAVRTRLHRAKKILKEISEATLNY